MGWEEKGTTEKTGMKSESEKMNIKGKIRYDNEEKQEKLIKRDDFALWECPP